eukprot:CAMPEP_0184663300 /NCGR_PEP_ID=MMETSP0308-20130426/47585_1 /TAXON_ID=38269 /ORGANISM="Gloeochaete witrockiana, Strain SAG 46.84" /LENGTH=316 /DNA_ID=CAMNT_0027105947 /DNA_START=216 /DNA_END=1166 /DNA_ORIENTATION=+
MTYLTIDEKAQQCADVVRAVPSVDISEPRRNASVEVRCEGQRRIFDCFSYFGELDLALVRFQELEKYVTAFIVVESAMTFTGNRKTLLFEAAMKEGFFDRWLPKIRYIIVTEMLNCSLNAWGCEAYQRDRVLDGLHDLQNDDLVIVGDCDEIVSAKTASELQCNTAPSFVAAHLQLRIYYYSFHWRHYLKFWDLSAVFTGNALKSIFSNSPDQARYCRNQKPCMDWTYPTIADAGWHCSYFMTPEQVRTKLLAFSHKEYSGPPYTSIEYISNKMHTGAGLFDDKVFEYEANPDPVPIAVRERPIQFAKFFAYAKLV